MSVLWKGVVTGENQNENRWASRGTFVGYARYENSGMGSVGGGMGPYTGKGKGQSA